MRIMYSTAVPVPFIQDSCLHGPRPERRCGLRPRAAGCGLRARRGSMSNAPLLRSTAPPALLPWGEWDRPDGLETLSNVQCFAVFVNAIIGTGVFALPFAVHHAGWVLSLAVLLVCAFFGWLTAGWTIEVCARAGAMVRAPPKAAAGRSGPEPALSLNAAAGDRRRAR
eukprot:COSAG02_NODE_18496_length_934_cov_1.029904_1_plen_167_part_10